MIKETSKGSQRQRGGRVQTSTLWATQKNWPLFYVKQKGLKGQGHRIMSVLLENSCLQKFQEVEEWESQKQHFQTRVQNECPFWTSFWTKPGGSEHLKTTSTPLPTSPPVPCCPHSSPLTAPTPVPCHPATFLECQQLCRASKLCCISKVKVFISTSSCKSTR